MVDQDVIGHLFDVERQAAELLSDAQDEYNKRLESIRTQADADFKDSYEKIIAEEESRYAAAIAQFDKEHTEIFNSFCSDVKNWKQDTTSFNALLDTLLFKKQG